MKNFILLLANLITIGICWAKTPSIPLETGYYGVEGYLISGLKAQVSQKTGQVVLIPSQNPLANYEGQDGLLTGGTFQCDFTGTTCVEMGPHNRRLLIQGTNQFLFEGNFFQFGGTELQTPEYFFGISGLMTIPEKTIHEVSYDALMLDATIGAQIKAQAKCLKHHAHCEVWGDSSVRPGMLCESLYNHPGPNQTYYLNRCTVISYARALNQEEQLPDEAPSNLPSVKTSQYHWFRNVLSGPKVDQAQVDRELKLQNDGNRIPDQAQELRIIQALDSIRNDIQSAGFNQMCRDTRAGSSGNIFFSRCLMIMLIDNNRKTANRNLIFQLQQENPKVLIMEMSMGIAN